MEYKQLLKKINLSSEDTVMIWGDCIERGSEPIKVLKDIMNGRVTFIYLAITK